MNVIRKDPRLKKQHGGNPFAKGRRAIAIDQRTGFKHLQSEMIFEPGTEYFVHRSENDKEHNLVTDPLNYFPSKMRTPEAIGLKHPSPDVPLSIGTIVSADQLYLPEYITSVEGNFLVLVSQPELIGLDFTDLNNSIYLLVLQGI